MPVANEAESRIVLIRHGRSAHVHRGWIDADGFRSWREAYDEAGIGESERPPAQLAQLVSKADVVIASDAPRATATARLLAPEREITVSPLFREMDLEGPELGGVRMPLRAWSFAVGGRILMHSIRRRYPSADETARIDSAAAMLDELAARNALVVVVTHAMFRRQLSTRLVQAGWQVEGSQRSMQPWSAWTFVRRTPMRTD